MARRTCSEPSACGAAEHTAVALPAGYRRGDPGVAGEQGTADAERGRDAAPGALHHPRRGLQAAEEEGDTVPGALPDLRGDS